MKQILIAVGLVLSACAHQPVSSNESNQSSREPAQNSNGTKTSAYFDCKTLNTGLDSLPKIFLLTLEKAGSNITQAAISPWVGKDVYTPLPGARGNVLEGVSNSVEADGSSHFSFEGGIRARGTSGIRGGYSGQLKLDGPWGGDAIYNCDPRK